MENIAVAGPSKEHVSAANEPAWLSIMLQDSLREADDALVIGQDMLGKTHIAIVWTLCEKFRCQKLGVLGHTCRVFERYLANLVRIGLNGNDQQGLCKCTPRLMLALACCFQIAMKSTSSTVHVCPMAIQAYLASYGIEFTIDEIMNMEREIFRGIGYRVPLYNILVMAEYLADHLNVDHNALRLIDLLVQMVELVRFDIEEQVRCTTGSARVRTIHLAAGCVVAAVEKACLQASYDVAIRLSRMLGVTGSYIMVLRDVILCLVDPSKPPAPKPNHSPNNLKWKSFATRAEHSEPQPSTSKSTLF